VATVAPTEDEAASTATATLPSDPPIVTAEPAATNTPEPTPIGASAEEVARVEPGQGEVALLFNADYFEGYIASILETTGARGASLTFFLTGGYLERFPEQVRAIDAAGHEIASHGYEHVDFRGLTDEEIAGHLGRWRERLAALTGKEGPAIWQPPYGYSDDRVREAARERGYTTIHWTLDTLDAVGAPKSKAFVLDRVLETSWVNLDGAIILMHVDKDGTVEALPAILDALAERGLRAVTVSELLRR
jgi:peptidoglycan/xylan/chitin deacetylase (PgdA/CDA1 family)